MGKVEAVILYIQLLATPGKAMRNIVSGDLHTVMVLIYCKMALLRARFIISRLVPTLIATARPGLAITDIGTAGGYT